MSDPIDRAFRFCKMEGAGNDFILVNPTRTGLVPQPGRLAQRICQRRTSVGADGLILVEPSPQEGAVLVRFWNPDGTEAQTCGNGTRCAARFAVMEGLAPEEMLIETAGGDIEARVEGEFVSLRFRAEPVIDVDFAVSSPEGTRLGHRVYVGLYHLVIPVEAIPDGPLEPVCRPLRYAPELEPEGANVNLAEVIDRHRIRIRTYERGVEAETLACGSGSMSSAMALCAAGQVESPVSVETESGDELTIRFQRREDGGFVLPELEGPARIVYWAELGAGQTTVG
jgi:diaminopimelate epimerase